MRTHAVEYREPPFDEHLQVVANPAPLALQGPAVVLINPKYAHNVGGAVRACAAFGVGQLWWTGERVDLPNFGGRLPREERMRGYRAVTMRHDPRPFDQARQPVTPVCVEIVPGSSPLTLFTHPPNAVYVFGPEDGSVPKAIRALCHQFVWIPTEHCLNLAAAINVVLYDRRLKGAADAH